MRRPQHNKMKTSQKSGYSFVKDIVFYKVLEWDSQLCNRDSMRCRAKEVDRNMYKSVCTRVGQFFYFFLQCTNESCNILVQKDLHLSQDYSVSDTVGFSKSIAPGMFSGFSDAARRRTSSALACILLGVRCKFTPSFPLLSLETFSLGTSNPCMD